MFNEVKKNVTLVHIWFPFFLMLYPGRVSPLELLLRTLYLLRIHQKITFKSE